MNELKSIAAETSFATRNALFRVLRGVFVRECLRYVNFHRMEAATRRLPGCVSLDPLAARCASGSVCYNICNNF